jgi:hypothetical protein
MSSLLHVINLQGSDLADCRARTDSMGPIGEMSSLIQFQPPKAQVRLDHSTTKREKRTILLDLSATE